jgi:hypothetical protein
MGRSYDMFLETIEVLVGRPEGRTPLGKPSSRWDGIIKIDLKEVGKGGIDCSALVQYRIRWWAIVYAVMNFRFH